MTNYSVGHTAEEYAEKYLRQLNYEILAVNYKTRQYEVDIIAKNKNQLHFVEVKYRQTPRQGTGFEYITPVKLRQMRFAATMWVNEHGWTGDYTLSAIELSGSNYKITGYLPFLV